MVPSKLLFDLKNPRAVRLVKWLNKKGLSKIQELHHQQTTQLQQAIADRYDQVQAIQYEKVTKRCLSDPAKKLWKPPASSDVFWYPLYGMGTQKSLPK